MTLALVWVIGLTTVGGVVTFHHLALRTLAIRILPGLRARRRRSVVLVVLTLFTAHVLEAQAFGLVMFTSAEHLGLGTLSGVLNRPVVEYLYFSLSTYTSLGLGDLAPIGHMRLLAGLEALIGLLLIGWSSSFLFVEMRGYWTRD